MCEKELNPEKWALDLLQKRILYLDGSTTPITARQLGRAIVWLNAQDEEKPITLYIDSPGGNADAGLDICDIIRHSHAPIIGIVYRQANSMAATILQVCTTRKCLPNACILVHSLRLCEAPLDELEDNPEKALAKTRRTQAIVNKIIQSRTGFSDKRMKEINKKGEFFTSEKALSLGLIDEIIDSV